MNMKKNVTMLTLAAMIAAGSVSFAQNNKTDAESEPTEEQSVAQVQVKGVLEKTAAGIVLLDGETAYLLKGKKDLEPLLGKTVMVTGDGVSSDAGMEILVKQIAVLK